jgi:hypothetical protein
MRVFFRGRRSKDRSLSRGACDIRRTCHTRAARSLGPVRRDGMAPHELAEGSGRDSKATRSKTHAPSESTRHGEDTLAVTAGDDANEPCRSRVFLAHSCHKSGEIRLPREGMTLAVGCCAAPSRADQEKLRLTRQNVITVLGAVRNIQLQATPTIPALIKKALF